MSLAPLPAIMIEPIVRAALLEDLGRAGDLTSEATIPADRQARVVLTTRQDGSIAGLDAGLMAFTLFDPRLAVRKQVEDGQRVTRGQTLATIEGAARSLLSAERVALNLTGQLSGVATATRRFVDAVEGTRARIVCTRKTTPGLRALEKFAVRCGGGVNHRFGLDDGILIKDNHIAIAGGVTIAIQSARAHAGHMVRIEVEVDTLGQLHEALAAGADAVLLDNMKPAQLREAVAINAGRAVLEASGGVTLDNVRAIAETGVDLISTGWITHSAPVLDIGLDFVATL
ncbi:MAG TPA: carboxylating nicotinate-nucleotide diphosphorylase [Alphaproteobacteria bacterium]|nr:carboxylating nicotinate-nucleotide diphosphorylase [Alphaproteobacteria bacterium]